MAELEKFIVDRVQSLEQENEELKQQVSADKRVINELAGQLTSLHEIIKKFGHRDGQHFSLHVYGDGWCTKEEEIRAFNKLVSILPPPDPKPEVEPESEEETKEEK